MIAGDDDHAAEGGRLRDPAFEKSHGLRHRGAVDPRAKDFNGGQVGGRRMIDGWHRLSSVGGSEDPAPIDGHGTPWPYQGTRSVPLRLAVSANDPVYTAAIVGTARDTCAVIQA